MRWAIVLSALLLSGCVDNMNNRDTITLGAGDAMEANLALQTLDPFPPEAKNTHIPANRVKVQQAYSRYLAGPKKEGRQVDNNNPCDYPDQIAADGSRCGGRAANERHGGEDPGARGTGY